MKKTFFFLAIASIFTVFTSFRAMPPIIIDTHFEQDVSLNLANPCNSEMVSINGHEIYDLLVVDNNRRITISSHARGNYSGTGSMGNNYIVRAFYNQTENGSYNNGAYSAIYVYRAQFISQGNAPNFTQIIRQKITVTANGDVTVLTLDITTECSN